MYEIESYQAKEGTVHVYHDECAESPREWDNLWQFVSNRRSDSMNETNFPDLDYIMENHKAIERDYIIVPVYMYNHGGVALSLESFIGRAPHAEWDSGVGYFALVSKARLHEEYRSKIVTASVRERAMSCLKGEVETFGKWLNGDVYGFIIEDEYGNQGDSCWGYYDIEDIKAEYPEYEKELEVA